MRITLVISSMWGGGAERVLSVLASGWAEQGHDITLLTFEEEGGLAYPIQERVKIQRLSLLHASSYRLEGLFRNFHRVRVLRRAIWKSQPELIISFMDQVNVLTLLATRGFRTPVIISEHIDPLHYHVGWLWSGLRRIVYPLADMLVCPTRSTLARFQAIAKVPGTVIANPVVMSSPIYPRQRNGPPTGYTLVAMGRLVQQKGFDLLLEAFSRIADQHPAWSLTIIGKGPLRSQLEEQRRVLALNDRVHFAGELADPFPALCAADLFVFSSRVEGFGMALAEAMACGLAVVSFDCPSGPGEIVRHDVDGVLVPPQDTAALAAMLDRLMTNQKERQRLAARAPEVLHRFDLDKILLLWQQIFDQLAPEAKLWRGARAADPQPAEAGPSRP
jgi:GalNAc-alpha-(1->4)-GalNAc-alpha-(1->3)-diNAcBac-PP-undecaprenol alpha-1,4-N-acetyl-D-galactosaminyltransferase